MALEEQAMNETVDLLLAVQGLDLEMADLLRQVAAAKAALDEPTELVAARADLSQAEGELRRQAARQRAVEGEVADLKAKLVALDRRFSADVGANARAMASLESEISHRRQQVAAGEDEIVELMVATEAQEVELRRRRDAVIAFEALHAGRLPALHGALEALEARGVAIKAQRIALAGRVPPAAMQVYRTLAGSGKGKPVVRMISGVCHGCGATLPTAEAQRLRMSPDLPRCPRCGHIVAMA